MQKLLLGILILIPVMLFTSCSSSQSSTVVAEYGQDQITYNEVKDAYYKSLGEAEKAKADSTEELKEFLDLYVNYKMKLRDAYVRGFDNDPEIQEEIEEYTQTVGIPYIEQKFIIEPGMKDLYEKRKTEKRISHILIRTDSLSIDSAKTLAEGLLTRIKNGEDFDKLAYDYSKDGFSKPDSGDIYWLTAGQTVPEFDEAMFKTKKGEVYPELIETKYGFHLLKVTDEQPRIFKVKAQHILVAFMQGDKVDTAAALKKIQEVQDKLKDGQSFSELAKEYSDDKGSAQKGGDLGYFQRRMMVKPFDEAVFGLKVGEVSDIVETRFGFHIIKLEDVKEYPSFEDEKENTKSMYQRSLYKTDKEQYINDLKKQYSFEIMDSLIEKVSHISSSLTFGDGYWTSDIKDSYGEKIMMKLGNRSYSLNDIMDNYKQDPNYINSKMIFINMQKMFNDFSEKILFGKKAFELKNSDTEFSKLMEDYKNGLYIFKLQEEEIWNKLEVDTTELVELYEETKDQYIWSNRASFLTIFRPDSQSIYQDYSSLDTGLSFEEIMEKNANSSKLKSKTTEHKDLSVNSSDLAKVAYGLSKEGDISKPVKLGSDWYIVKLVEKFPFTQKTFDEAKSEVMALWQEKQTKKLEEDYINQLRKIYEPEIYYDRLYEANNN